MSQSQTLLLLLVGLPPSPSSLRVRVWRRLRGLGAVALKRSAYLLPDTPERYEDFQWLAQEIQREGGEATLIRVQQIENIAQRTRSAGCSTSRATRTTGSSPARYRKVLARLDRKSAAASARVQEELARLAKDHQRIRDIDFFDAPGGAEVRRLEEAIAMRTRRPESPAATSGPARSRQAARPAVGHAPAAPHRPHRVGVADQALHRSRGDLRVRAARRTSRRTPFPSTRPVWSCSHHGEDCTFETLVKRAKMRGPPARAARRGRPRGRSARRQVPARGGPRHRRRHPRAARRVARRSPGAARRA